MTSDLAAFASEEPLSTADGAIPLTQVASRKTSVSWMEALACIQQICDAVIASGKGPLDESSIYLHDSGTVSIEASGETTPEESVRFVGDLLCAWLEGTPHQFFYRDSAGNPSPETLRLAGNTLLWEQDGVTFRLEAQVARDEALRIASSFR